jgi:hypothetical protein
MFFYVHPETQRNDMERNVEFTFLGMSTKDSRVIVLLTLFHNFQVVKMSIQYSCDARRYNWIGWAHKYLKLPRV